MLKHSQFWPVWAILALLVPFDWYLYSYTAQAARHSQAEPGYVYVS